MIKQSITITLCIFLATSMLHGCHNVPIWKYDMFEHPPSKQEYPPMYLHGWKHGCQSGAEASSNYLYRWKYQFTQDWQLLDNPQYVSGWEDAYNHCRKYVLQHNQRTFK